MSQLLPARTETAMGWGNRGSLDIINLILSVCRNGTMITHIMYQCNLNSKQTQAYVSLLVKYELLEKKVSETTSKGVYQATEKARKYLDAYSELSGIFDLPLEEKAPDLTV
jgi:predicted transcriptional regulator